MERKRKNANSHIFSERLKEMRTEWGLTQVQLAEKIGSDQGSVARWESGKGGLPHADTLARIAAFFAQDVRFFLGEMERVYPKESGSALEVSESPKSWGGPYYGTSETAPVVQPVSAGNARAWEDAGYEAPRVRVNCPDPNCYCVTVWNDSMQPIYHEGDILVIAPNLQVSPNDLVVVRTAGDEAYFKKFVGMRKGRYRFASLNPNYEMKEIDAEEMVRMHPVHSVIRPLKGKIF